MNIVTIIVNYQTATLAVNCLESLAPIACESHHFSVELLDADSGDDSVCVLANAIQQRGWQSWVRLTALSENRGFAAANNVGIAAALSRPQRPDAVWLLNPDTIVLPGALTPLLETLQSHPSAGIVGSRLQCRDGELQSSAFRFPHIRSELIDAWRFSIVNRMLKDHEVALKPCSHACEVDWVSGASFLIRSEVFEQIGMLDDGYFMYYEEVDFCHRAKQAGFTTWCQPESRVIHLVGQSSGVTGEQAILRQRPRYWFDSRRRYFFSKHGSLRTGIADAVWLSGRACWIVRATLQRKPVEDPPKLWRDFLCNSVFVRGLSR
ncbi:N-acetylglucosaminyl-diphospho-decaprenol L-rhamnosyltransferase [Novipirellula galeiformis]|uniref:N-acetylglucosaminyl-diphospho-decaprenol L-rhamnosyltransferase n=1 Tax=Novipirellula galeiformis TaxID=2528004 RepID=A0A5C6CM78_9BACT|nr:glycosyltransferase family 2 protein [Novipirellula galeiformis]TWU23949.1 N-acetylglucosaminyl-diphospho-decaprenol L-rhamnosyltransferase [Novipirellula galeiformis]